MELKITISDVVSVISIPGLDVEAEDDRECLRSVLVRVPNCKVKENNMFHIEKFPLALAQ